MSSPTDAIVVAILASTIGNPDEIYHALIIAQVLAHALEVRITVADHNCLGVI